MCQILTRPPPLQVQKISQQCHVEIRVSTPFPFPFSPIHDIVLEELKGFIILICLDCTHTLLKLHVGDGLK
jgi:hypothetical protein